jgi:hypothetical protein
VGVDEVAKNAADQGFIRLCHESSKDVGLSIMPPHGQPLTLLRACDGRAWRNAA